MQCRSFGVLAGVALLAAALPARAHHSFAAVFDPKVLTGPWIVPKQTLRLAPFDQIMEVGCTGTETAALMEAASKVNYGKK